MPYNRVYYTGLLIYLIQIRLIDLIDYIVLPFGAGSRVQETSTISSITSETTCPDKHQINYTSRQMYLLTYLQSDFY